ncbi:glycosyltransferase [Candidatus Woesearchaeota archaeon]|nr:glycosyltransferase [Candidatus Woesearchaeota archaeon]
MANINKELSIVIPAYNEEERISKTLKKYTNFFNKRLDYEILVVLNGCKDKTLDIVKKYAGKNVKYINIKEAIGKGGAVIEGFNIVGGKYMAFVDADSSTEPDQLYYIYNRLKNSDYDGVIGSRWCKGAKIMKYQPLKRVIASRVYNTMVRLILFLPYSDTQAGAKAFRNNAIKSILGTVIPVGWEFDVALLYALRKKGFRIKEVPIIWADTLGSSLKITKTAPKMLKSLLRIRLENSVFKGLLR